MGFGYIFLNFFGLNCRSTGSTKLLVSLARIQGFAGFDCDPSYLLKTLWFPVSARVKNCVLI